MTVRTMVEAINHTLAREMARDERIIVFGEDVGANGGVFRATDGLIDRFGPDRVVDTPLAEALILGTAVGLAASGMVPVPEIQFLGFSYQAFHQLAGQIARLRYRSNGRFDAPITMRAPFGGGVRTPELHSEALEGQLANIPGLKVVMPASAHDAAGLLTSAIRDPDPVLFLEPLRGYRSLRDDLPDDADVIEPLGRAKLVREGTDLVIVAWSYQVEVARKAAEALAEEGASVAVLDLRSMVPLDIDALAAVVSRCGRVVVAEEAPMTAGFGGEVVATIVEECFYDLEAPPVRVSGYDVPFPMAQLEDRDVPSVARLAAGCRRALEVAP
ncbi:MAG: alpha-ketoacid dehydrogenase subunit beta [Acidimicrobiales bacterium]|nr:alpha-ketoacid dehydrogenase subunit beta [Acidimicrobiales bacterium]